MFRPLAQRHRHDVESKAQIAPFRMLGQEGLCRPFDAALLLRRDRFERLHQRLARFDFNRGNDLATLGNQVDFTGRRAVALGQDAPALKA